MQQVSELPDKCVQAEQRQWGGGESVGGVQTTQVCKRWGRSEEEQSSGLTPQKARRPPPLPPEPWEDKQLRAS